MSKKCKIYLVTKYFTPALTGAGNRFINMHPYLKRKNVELSVLTIKYYDASLYEEINGIKIFRFDVFDGKNATYALQEFAYRFAIKKKPDAIIFLHHSYHSFIYIAMLRLRNIICIRNVTMMPKVHHRNLKHYFYMFMCFNIFSKIYCLNEAMNIRLIKNGLKSNKAFISPNGVDTNRFSPLRSISLKSTLREKLKLPKNVKIILFVGNLVRRKGVDLLLNAWAKICNDSKACLLLVGSTNFTGQQTDTIFKNELEKKIGRINKNKLIIREYSKNIEQYYQAADIFVFLSRREGMPNALLEAMSCGLPSLITPFEGLSIELGKENVHYYLTNFSEKKIVADLIKIINDENSEQIGENASLLIKNVLSIEKSASNLVENIINQ